MYCGICGKKLAGNSFHRSDFNVYICQDCYRVGSQLSTHETIKQCPNCGFRFLPGFASWYYESDKPKCIVCESDLTTNWTFEKLLNILQNPDSKRDEVSDAMHVFEYGKLPNDKGEQLELSKEQRLQFLLVAIKSPYLGVHYKAYFELKKWEVQTQEIKKAILSYEDEHPES